MTQNNQSLGLENHTVFSGTFQPDQLTIGFISPARAILTALFPAWRTRPRSSSASIRAMLRRCGCAMCRFTTRHLAIPARSSIRWCTRAGWQRSLIESPSALPASSARCESRLSPPSRSLRRTNYWEAAFSLAWLRVTGQQSTRLSGSTLPAERNAIGSANADQNADFRVISAPEDTAFRPVAGRYRSGTQTRSSTGPYHRHRSCWTEPGWLAANVDAWIWHGDALRMPEAVPHWREATASRGFVPFGYGAMFDLDTNPDAPLQTGRVLKGGRKALKDFFSRQREAGINHVALNLKPTRRPLWR